MDNPDNSLTEAGLDAFKVYRTLLNPSLWADEYSISVASGTVMNFFLKAGTGYAGRSYLLLASLSGNVPGFYLPSGRLVPLNWDAFTNVVLGLMGSPVFQGFTGALDGSGSAQATFDTLGSVDPILIGLSATFAFLTGPPPGWDFTSNSVEVAFIP
jgi:hypothetical protein